MAPSSRKRRDIVHDRGTGVQRGLGHTGLHRVDGKNQRRMLPDQRLDHRDDPPQLLLLRAPTRCGPAGWTRRRRPEWRHPLASNLLTVGQRGVDLANRPPSLKLSGVTLRIPTRTGVLQRHRTPGSLPAGDRFGRQHQRDSLGQLCSMVRERSRAGPGHSGGSGCRPGSPRSLRSPPRARAHLQKGPGPRWLPGPVR